jgi:hypothetical protein
MKKISTTVALLLAISATKAQTTFRPDSSFNGNGIFSTNGAAGNNANAFATGGIVNNDGSVWLAGSINAIGNSKWTHYISRLKANGSADSNFCNVGASGYVYTFWQTMGFLKEMYPVKNGGVFVPHSGYGGYYATSNTASTISKEVYDDYDGLSIVASAQINDSVIVELGSSPNLYTYKGTGSNSYLGENWFNNGATYYGPLPTNLIANSVVKFTGIATQSTGKILVYGYQDSANYYLPFIIRLKSNTYNVVDSTYGSNGISYAPRNVFSATQISSSYVQNDDKIILHNGEYFMRLNTDGTYDASFGYFKAYGADGTSTGFANARKFVTNSTNTELYGISQNFSGDHTVFGVYTNGKQMNSFHNGKNYFRKLDADVNYSGLLELNDISINNAGDILVVGSAIKIPGGVYEIFAMKLKKGECNPITVSTQQLNDTTVKITVGGTNGGDINISYNENILTLGAGTTSGNIVLPLGTYTITVWQTNGCEGTAVVTTYPMAITNTTYSTFTTFPNPATDRIRFNVSNLSANAMASITTIDGKVISNNKISGNSINVSSLQKGLYFLQINDGAQQYTSRFIIN